VNGNTPSSPPAQHLGVREDTPAPGKPTRVVRISEERAAESDSFLHIEAPDRGGARGDTPVKTLARFELRLVKMATGSEPAED
jgi:hypothetical protein